MRVDELIFSQREFLKELYALCKKWNTEIDGCGCCGSPTVEFSDGELFENLFVDSKGLHVKTSDGYAFLFDNYHDIQIACEDADMDGDGCYICQRVTASCPKCGKHVTVTRKGREEAERLAVDELGGMPCE